MISNIDIENFQSHSKTSIELCSGVNVIVGKSDSGKSAILRALRLVTENKPAGTEFINHNSDSTCVSVKFDGNNIRREKNRKTLNSYFINGEVLKAFGQDTPKPVKDVVMFHDVNTQWQLDPPFMLSKTPGECSQYLNEVMNLEVIDSVTAKIQSETRSLMAEIKIHTAKLEELKKSFENLYWVDAVEELAEKLKYREQNIERIECNIVELQEIVDTIKRNERCEVPDLDKEFDKCEEYLDRIERLDFAGISSIVEHILMLQEKEKSITESIECVRRELSKFKICELCGRPL